MSDSAIEILEGRKKELLSERDWVELRIQSLKNDLETSEQRLEEQELQIAKIEKAIKQLGGNID